MAAAEGDRAIIEFMQGGDAARARAATEDVLSQFRALGDRYSEGIALTALGNFACAQGDLAEATHRFEEALAIARESGDSHGEVLCLCNLALTARLSGELDQAAIHSIWKDSGWPTASAPRGLLDSLAGIGGLAVERRQFERAARLLGAAAALADAVGTPLQSAEQTQFDRDIAAVRAALPEACFLRAWTAGRSLPLDAAVAEAWKGQARPARRSRAAIGLSDRELDVLAAARQRHVGPRDRRGVVHQPGDRDDPRQAYPRQAGRSLPRRRCCVCRSPWARLILFNAPWCGGQELHEASERSIGATTGFAP